MVVQVAKQPGGVDEARKDHIPQSFLAQPPNVFRAQLVRLHQTGGRVLVADQDIGLLWVEVPLALRAAVIFLDFVKPLSRSRAPFEPEMGMH